MNALLHGLRAAIAIGRITLFLATVSLCLSLNGQQNATRPRITRIHHVRIYVSDVGRSWRFYSHILALPTEGGGCGTARPCLPVNERQQLEFQRVPSTEPANWLAEVAFATENVAQMRHYLQANGAKPGEIAKDANGTQHIELHDPEGNPIAFVQPATTQTIEHSVEQVGKRLFHAGFVVQDASAEDRFYRDILGFRMYWHGGFKDNDVDWEELQVPDGSDWIEYMLNIPSTADHKERGIQNHFSLGVTKITSAYNLLVAHGLKPNDDDKPEIGRDGKWSFDIYDPDQTRVEFMEFTPAQKPCCHTYEAAHPVP
jgi:catechol 2,3-dioxygenase-like lactoylglutathione lyase family enzyme